MHNLVALDLYDFLTDDSTFVPLCVPVDVYVNGNYQGVYTLCDQIETGSQRVDIDSTLQENPAETDYLLEQDYRAYLTGSNSGTEGVDWFWMQEINECFVVKSPDMEDTPSEEHTAYIKSYMDTVYSAILSKDWQEVQSLIDVDSFIDGFMAADIVQSQDITQSSVYYYKKAGGKLTFGPLWDCDLAMGGGDSGEPEKESFVMNNFLFGNLMKIPEFHDAYIQKFTSVKDAALQEMLDKITTLYADYETEFSNDFETWEKPYKWCSDEMKTITDYEGQITYMKDWLNKRFAYLEKQYAQ